MITSYENKFIVGQDQGSCEISTPLLLMADKIRKGHDFEPTICEIRQNRVQGIDGPVATCPSIMKNDDRTGSDLPEDVAGGKPGRWNLRIERINRAQSSTIAILLDDIEDTLREPT